MKVLSVAEKPSVAKELANIIGGANIRRVLFNSFFFHLFFSLIFFTSFSLLLFTSFSHSFILFFLLIEKWLFTI